MPKGIQCSGADDGTARRTGLALRPGRARTSTPRRCCWSAGKVRSDARLRLLQPAGARLRRGPARGQADRRRPGDRHPPRRPRARGARRSRPWSLAASADGGTFGQVPGLYIRVARRGRRRRDRPLRQRGRHASRPPSSSASSTAARAPGSSAPWARATAAGWKASPRTSASPWTNRSRRRARTGRPAAPRRRRPPPPPPPTVPPPPPPRPPPRPPRRPARRPPAPPRPVRLTKVTLTKEAPSVSLTKQGGTSGALRVNLNWQVRKQFSGLGQQAAAGPSPCTRTSTSTCAPCSNSPTAARASSRRSATPSARCTSRRSSTSTATTAPAPSASGENLTVNLDHKHVLPPHPRLRHHLRGRPLLRRPARHGHPPAAARRRRSTSPSTSAPSPPPSARSP